MRTYKPILLYFYAQRSILELAEVFSLIFLSIIILMGLICPFRWSNEIIWTKINLLGRILESHKGGSYIG